MSYEYMTGMGYATRNIDQELAAKGITPEGSTPTLSPIQTVGATALKTETSTATVGGSRTISPVASTVGGGASVASIGPMDVSAGGESSDTRNIGAIIGTVARVFTGDIPAGNVPVPPAERAWFKSFVRTHSGPLYTEHMAVDSGFTWFDPNVYAKFLNGKAQVMRLKRAGVYNMAVGAGGAPLTGLLRTAAVTKRNHILEFWKRCDDEGATAWKSAPGTVVASMAMPRSIYNRFQGYSGRIVGVSCASVRSLWQRTSGSERVTGPQLLERYLQSKIDAAAAAEAAADERIDDAEARRRAAQQALDEANTALDEKNQQVSNLEGNVTNLNATITDLQSQLTAALAAAGTGNGADAALVEQLTARVAELTQQLTDTQQRLEDARGEQSSIQQEVRTAQIESGDWFGAYKWHIGIGVLVLAGVGYWWWSKNKAEVGMTENYELPEPTDPRRPSGIYKNKLRNIVL